MVMGQTCASRSWRAPPASSLRVRPATCVDAVHPFSRTPPTDSADEFLEALQRVPEVRNPDDRHTVQQPSRRSAGMGARRMRVREAVRRPGSVGHELARRGSFLIGGRTTLPRRRGCRRTRIPHTSSAPTSRSRRSTTAYRRRYVRILPSARMQALQQPAGGGRANCNGHGYVLDGTSCWTDTNKRAKARWLVGREDAAKSASETAGDTADNVLHRQNRPGVRVDARVPQVHGTSRHRDSIRRRPRAPNEDVVGANRGMACTFTGWPFQCRSASPGYTGKCARVQER